MKKLYIAPELKVVRVNVNPLMHQSALLQLQLRGERASMTGTDYNALSRGNRFFSDDEE